MTYRILKPDGSVETIAGTPTLEKLQEAVGGWIERVPHLFGAPIGPEYEAYANEEGLLHQLSLNVRASELTGIPLVGTVVIVEKGSLK